MEDFNEYSDWLRFLILLNYSSYLMYKWESGYLLIVSTILSKGSLNICCILYFDIYLEGEILRLGLYLDLSPFIFKGIKLLFNYLPVTRKS